MLTFHLAKDGNKFIPADTESQIKAYKIKQGEVVKCKSISYRNYEFHKKFFALIQLAFQNMPEPYDKHFPTPEDLREELIKAAGFYTTHKDFNGNTVKKAESIAFDKMSQERFEQVYDKVLDLVCRMIGVEESEIMDQLLNFM